ncbi:hypothetical protein ACOAKC_12410 [Hathewaya histolytica]|uniref:hypothetical protein n=1 Tax=Hathewaya histolytica TaxID=1498 RepID=UPI003B6718B3
MKKLLSLVLTGAIVFSFTGCENMQKAKNETEKQTKNIGNQTEKQSEKVGEQVQEKSKNVGEQVKKQTENILGINSLKDLFRGAGFEVGEHEKIPAEKLGANNAHKVKVDNETIEVYEFDMKKLSAEGKRVTDEAKSGFVNISGTRTPVKYKDGIMLVGVDKHTKKEKISEIFNKFERK